MTCERVFGSGGGARGEVAPAVTAAELAELLLDEVSGARRDWRRVERLALDLAGLAARAVGSSQRAGRA